MFQTLKRNPWCQVCVGINWDTEEAGVRACARIGAGLVSDAKGFFGLCAAASVVVFLRVLGEKVNEDIRQRAEGLGPASPSQIISIILQLRCEYFIYFRLFKTSKIFQSMSAFKKNKV